MDIHLDRTAGRIVVRQPRHWIGWVAIAAGVLMVPATVWAYGIAASGHTAIAIGGALLAACFFGAAVLALTEVTATFDGGTRSLTVRRDRRLHASTRSIPFADIAEVTATRHWWPDGNEYRFTIVLSRGRNVWMRYDADDESLVRSVVGEINHLARR